MRDPTSDRRSTRGLPALGLGLLLALGAPASAEPVPASQALERVASLRRLLRRPGSETGEILAALDAAMEASRELVPDARSPGALPSTADREARSAERSFRQDLEAAVLDALVLDRLPHGTHVNTRHRVQVRAAVALGDLSPSILPRVLDVAKRRVLRDQDYVREPGFYEALFQSLLRLAADDPDRLRAVGAWLSEEAISADTGSDAQAATEAALRLLATTPDLPGALRREIVDHEIDVFQAYEYHWVNKYEAVAGFRTGSKRFRDVAGPNSPYWMEVRPLLLDTWRRLGTDPITGEPPIDPETADVPATLPRWVAWMLDHANPGRPPWRDGPRAPDEDGADRVVLPLATYYERMYGGAWWLGFAHLHVPGAGDPERGPRADGAPADPSGPAPEMLAALIHEALAAGAPTELRAAAVMGTARLGLEDARTVLGACLEKDAAQRVRETAALWLGTLDDPESLALLERRARDTGENLRVRTHAVLALGHRGQAAWIREHVLDAGKSLARDRLHREEIEVCAVRALGLGSTSGNATFLAEILTERRRPDTLRAAAGEALAQVATADQRDAVLSLLRDARPDDDLLPIQVAAALALPRVITAGDDDALDRVAAYLEKSRSTFGGVRAQLLLSLAEIGGPRAEEIVRAHAVRTIKDTTRTAERGWCLLALGRLHRPAATEDVLRDLAAFDHPLDRAAALVAVGLSEAGKARPEVRRALADAPRGVAPAAILAAGMLGDTSAVDAIRASVATGDPDGRRAAAATALARLLGPAAADDLRGIWEACRTTEEREPVARAYARVTDPESVRFLVGVVRDAERSGPERAQALAALVRMALPGRKSWCDVFGHDVDVYVHVPTLAALARWRDVAFLE